MLLHRWHGGHVRRIGGQLLLMRPQAAVDATGQPLCKAPLQQQRMSSAIIMSAGLVKQSVRNTAAYGLQ